MAQNNSQKWVGFDLDDTLHHFRKATTEAMEAVYGYVYEEFGVLLDKQRDAYKDILKAGQSGHFAQNKPSSSYRAERFVNLLEAFDILPYRHADLMVELYDRALERMLEPTDGALPLLQALKDHGFNIMVVSEGPHDAQETTLGRLGMAGYADLLVTSAQEGKSKAEGLLGIAMDKAGVAPEDMIYIGDNYDRDIVPAQALGVRAIHLSPEPRGQGIATVSSLQKLVDSFDDIFGPETVKKKLMAKVRKFGL